MFINITAKKMHNFWTFKLFLMCYIFLRINGQILNEKDRNAILYAHNELRKSVDPTAANMREMEWNDCLAEVAYEYLMQCTGSEHNEIRQIQAEEKDCEASDQAVGENKYQTAEKITDFNVVTTAWAAEKESFNYETLECSDVCEHYKQMVWFDSFLIGCAELDQAMCNGEGTIVVCNYARGGNTVGVKPYTQGFQCSECMGPWDTSCNDGLCSRNGGSNLIPHKIIILLVIYASLQVYGL